MSEAARKGRKILLVEDDEAMAVGVKDGLEFEGFHVLVARDGVGGLKMVESERPDVVLLDVMLPKMNGMDLCRKVRADGNRVPIIMLTARGQEIDKVLGLRTGADDYITKPFSFMELMARVEALLRRTQGPGVSLEDYRFGDVEVSFARGELTKKGSAVETTPRELRLLQYFVEHRGQVVTRDQLLEDVWGQDSSVFTRTVDMHIAKLRKKIEDRPADPRHILTIHGSGYRFTG